MEHTTEIDLLFRFEPKINNISIFTFLNCIGEIAEIFSSH